MSLPAPHWRPSADGGLVMERSGLELNGQLPVRLGSMRLLLLLLLVRPRLVTLMHLLLLRRGWPLLGAVAVVVVVTAKAGIPLGW